jgi:hypothetical protein
MGIVANIYVPCTHKGMQKGFQQWFRDMIYCNDNVRRL